MTGAIHSKCEKYSLRRLGSVTGFSARDTLTSTLSECQQQRNRRIAKVRTRVEHVFAMINQMGGKWVRTIGRA